MRPFDDTDTSRASHLVDAVVAVPLLGGVFAVLAALAAAHHPHRLPLLPVLGLGSIFVVDGDVTVESHGPENRRKP